MGWSVCQAAAKAGNSNRGNFFCTSLYALPQLAGLIVGAAVDIGGVEVAGDLVHLVPGTEAAVPRRSRARPDQGIKLKGGCAKSQKKICLRKNLKFHILCQI